MERRNRAGCPLAATCPPPIRTLARADSANSRKRWSRVAVAVGVLAWVAGVAWGLQKIQVYSTTPGEVAAAPVSWPGSPLVSHSSGKPTLVMFIHPQCSCTRASLAELQSILDGTRGALSAWVVVLKPPGMPVEWTHSATVAAARDMQGVTVVEDLHGTEANRFGASTSGDTVLYDGQGKLQFHGGITAARGHVSVTTPAASVLLVSSTRAKPTVTPMRCMAVGCTIHIPDRTMRKWIALTGMTTRTATLIRRYETFCRRRGNRGADRPSC